MRLNTLMFIGLLVGAVSLNGCGDDTDVDTDTDADADADTDTDTDTDSDTDTAGECEVFDCADDMDKQTACETAVNICRTTSPTPEIEEVCVNAAILDACGNE
jgi:hypothetical protein